MLYVDFFTQSAKHQFSADILKYLETGFDISCKLSRNVKLFSGKNKRIINMLSAEIAQRVLNINFQQIRF